LEYSQSSLKGKLVMSKRFTKYYFRHFQPITQLEKSDQDSSRLHYKCFTFITCLTCGFMSYRYRRMRVSMFEAHEAAKNVSAFDWQHIFNDAIMAFIGFTAGSLFACDYVYKRRMYVIERLHFEKEQQFNRGSYLQRGTTEMKAGVLPDEYPFAEYVTIKDSDLKEERIHPSEVKE
jgi:hypothetical protein